MTPQRVVRVTVRVLDPEGLHARPCAAIARAAAAFRSRVEVSHAGRTADARFVLQLLELSVLTSADVEIHAVGDDAAACAAAIAKLLAVPPRP